MCECFYCGVVVCLEDGHIDVHPLVCVFGDLFPSMVGGGCWSDEIG